GHSPNDGRALETPRALSADIDREITAITTTLETLATSRALLYEDFADFYAQAKEALRSRPWNVGLMGADERGDPVGALERGPDRRQPPAARQHARAVGHAPAHQQPQPGPAAYRK